MLNKMVVKTLPYIPKPLIHVFAKKYIAGPKLEDAIRMTENIEKEGGMTTIDLLGEFVNSREQAIHEKQEIVKILDAIKENNMPSYLSIKPTSLGLGIDFNFAYDNIRELVQKAKDYGQFVRLDMENSPYTTKTLELFRKFRADGFDNVGIVIQAYMRRSEEDIKSVIDLKPTIRLCKGIYKESREIAFHDPYEINFNYKKLLRLILDSGLYPGIATHDEELINYAREQIAERKLGREEYEFQMLLGVREERRRELLKEGHRLRVYVPFGEDWYGYSTRRLIENPDMAGTIFKSILKNLVNTN